MIRRLLILRHAKATPHSAADHARALAPRGLKDAARMGRYLREEHLWPDLVLSSDARRTLETAKLAAAAFDPPPPMQPNAQIYLADAARLLHVIREIPDDVKNCLLVGHNPGMHELAMLLAGFGDRYAAARLQSAMPTCSLAVIDFDTDWAQVSAHTGRLDRFIVPDDLEKAES